MRRARRVRAVVFGVLAASAAGLAVFAEPPAANQAAPGPPDKGENVAPPGVPILQAPPENDAEPAATNAASNVVHAKAATNSAVGANPAPPAPATPVRSPAAILQALDKVTTETMTFAAPVGQRVRYKNLVFTVKACETSGLGQAEPQASAYVEIVSAPLASPGVAPQPPREVFHGWMFSTTPELNPLQHPIYDAWLIACMAPPPKT
ncbi:MAG TPA: DUF2155 domain-containing protein [Caulobacteraceae bacterium]|nr:DUF2155 domain-containing protein [Caulobacteraceae bacterium]